MVPKFSLAFITLVAGLLSISATVVSASPRNFGPLAPNRSLPKIAARSAPTIPPGPIPRPKPRTLEFVDREPEELHFDSDSWGRIAARATLKRGSIRRPKPISREFIDFDDSHPDFGIGLETRGLEERPIWPAHIAARGQRYAPIAKPRPLNARGFFEARGLLTCTNCESYQGHSELS